jgi:hypothetical protein
MPVALCAAPALEIVKPAISQMEGGAPDPASFDHVAGEVLFFSCRIANYTKSPEEKIHIAYSVQAFDPKGVPLTEIYKNEFTDEVSPQDKDWTPKIATEVSIPPLVGSGAYKIVVKAEDLIAKTNTELAVPFQVRGREVAASDTLVTRNFRFYPREEATEPLQKAAYKTGGSLWARFDITGFKYGEGNKIDITYQISILSASGKVLFTGEPAVDQSNSFYPKRYISATFNIGLDTVKPAEYTILVAVKDAIGQQSFESKHNFRVE